MNMQSGALRLGRDLFAFTALVAMSACTTARMRVGEMQADSRSVELAGAKSVRVELKMRAGELKITGGSPNLTDAEFRYNVSAFKPRVDYHVGGGEGRLEIEQPGGGTSSGGTHNQWDLRLNNSVPMELHVEMGAGRAELTLGTLSLSRFDLDMGAGETVLDLTGNWKHDLSAHIQGGVGSGTIRLPRDVGVHVTVQGGIGTVNAHDFKRAGDAYVNDAYGKSHVTLNLDVQGGVGEIDLELAGNRPVV